MTGLELGIVTSDAARLVRFYVDGFGFEVLSSMEFPQGSVTRLRRGDAGVKIHQPAGGAETRELAEPWSRFAGMAYGALLVADAGAQAEQAVRAGATILVPVTNHRPGAWFSLIRDPEGNVWEILQETPA